MARRSSITAHGADQAILPRHLVELEGLTAAEHRERNLERREWFQSRGINPGDWSQVYPVLRASWAAHGIESAADRARRRFAETQVGAP